MPGLFSIKRCQVYFRKKETDLALYPRYTMRASGIDTGGPPALGQPDRQAFANQLDRLLTRHLRG